MTGITRQERESKGSPFLRALKEATFRNPQEKASDIMEYIHEVETNPECMQILNEWGFRVEPKLARFDGRVLDACKVLFNNDAPAFQNFSAAEWQIRADKLRVPPSIPLWCVLNFPTSSSLKIC